MDFYRPPTNQGAVDALVSVYRALQAWKFYPKRHPTRRSSLENAHSALLGVLDGNDLSFSCKRTGFSFPDGERLTDSTVLSVTLSRELFIRRVIKLTFLSDLRREDLLDFLRIIALPPDTIHKMGGFDKIMIEHGICSIWANEFDLSEIRKKRSKVEARGVTPPSIDEAEGSEEATAPIELQLSQKDETTPELQLQALLGRLATVSDENVYAMLLNQAIECAVVLKSRLDYFAVFPLIELLASHLGDEKRSSTMHEFDRFALEQLSVGDEFLRFTFGRIEQVDGLSKSALQAIIVAGGPPAIMQAVEQLGIASNLAERKTISTLLTNSGEMAVPMLLVPLVDKRWYVVRNICAILGAIACNDAIPGLITCLQHSDIRVCKEAIRSLAKIGGRDAESALIGILRGNDKELYPQAMASLGGIKSRKSLPDLMRILSAKDLLLKSYSTKVDSLAAIAMIGDKQVTPRLLELLAERHILAANSWNLFKVALIQCLGRLGDDRALPALKKHITRSGKLGAACSETIELIERSGGNADGRT